MKFADINVPVDTKGPEMAPAACFLSPVWILPIGSIVIHCLDSRIRSLNAGYVIPFIVDASFKNKNKMWHCTIIGLVYFAMLLVGNIITISIFFRYGFCLFEF